MLAHLEEAHIGEMGILDHVVERVHGAHRQSGLSQEFEPLPRRPCGKNLVERAVKEFRRFVRAGRVARRGSSTRSSRPTTFRKRRHCFIVNR